MRQAQPSAWGACRIMSRLSSEALKDLKRNAPDEAVPSVRNFAERAMRLETDQQVHNNKTQCPAWQFRCRENRGTNLNDESRGNV
jgi:hypothetical protein